MQARSVLRRLAYVAINPDRSLENTRFAETVAVNRGASVRVFETLEDARAWLQQTAERGAHGGRRPAAGGGVAHDSASAYD